jgi:hypothetical protein
LWHFVASRYASGLATFNSTNGRPLLLRNRNGVNPRGTFSNDSLGSRRASFFVLMHQHQTADRPPLRSARWGDTLGYNAITGNGRHLGEGACRIQLADGTPGKIDR